MFDRHHGKARRHLVRRPLLDRRSRRRRSNTRAVAAPQHRARPIGTTDDLILERSDIEWALKQLAVRLGDARQTVSKSVVGGAAIVLEHNPDRGSTNDIDGWINAAPATRTAVDSVIADISPERGEPDDWPNDQRVHPRGRRGQGLSRGDVHRLTRRRSRALRGPLPRGPVEGKAKAWLDQHFPVDPQPTH